MPSYAESCVISDDRDHPVASLSKTTYVLHGRDLQMFDSLSGDVRHLRLRYSDMSFPPEQSSLSPFGNVFKINKLQC